MGRLRRFPDNRFVGRRDEMRVYDCDDSLQFEELSQAVAAEGLDMSNQLQAFAPDSLTEAANRGFKPPPPVDTSDTFE
jgi:hypothetical protein